MRFFPSTVEKRSHLSFLKDFCSTFIWHVLSGRNWGFTLHHSPQTAHTLWFPGIQQTSKSFQTRSTSLLSNIHRGVSPDGIGQRPGWGTSVKVDALSRGRPTHFCFLLLMSKLSSPAAELKASRVRQIFPSQQGFGNLLTREEDIWINLINPLRVDTHYELKPGSAIQQWSERISRGPSKSGPHSDRRTGPEGRRTNVWPGSDPTGNSNDTSRWKNESSFTNKEEEGSDSCDEERRHIP